MAGRSAAGNIQSLSPAGTTRTVLFVSLQHQHHLHQHQQQHQLGVFSTFCPYVTTVKA